MADAGLFLKFSEGPNPCVIRISTSFNCRSKKIVAAIATAGNQGNAGTLLAIIGDLMSMKPIYSAVLAVALLSTSACATITRGTTEAFVIETTPGGAKARTSLGMMCEPTPCVIPKVSREAEFTVTIEKEGYKTATYNVTHEMAGGGGAGMAGNVLLGGVIGAAIDANSGATQRLVPNPLSVTLEPVEQVKVAVEPAAAPAVVAEPQTATASEAPVS